jgi:hypothetical protein
MTDKVEMCHTAQAMSLCMIISIHIACGHLVPCKLMVGSHDSPVSLVRNWQLPRHCEHGFIHNEMWCYLFYPQSKHQASQLKLPSSQQRYLRWSQGKTCKCTSSSKDYSGKALLQMWCAGKSAIKTEAHVDRSSKRLDFTTYSIHDSRFLFKQGNIYLLIFVTLTTELFHL